MTTQEALDAIYNYILKNGGKYFEWYIGVAADPKERLFNNHSVNEKADCWIYCPCSSSIDARNVEAYFVKLGTKGGTGGGDYSTIHVYAYKIAPHTVETA